MRSNSFTHDFRAAPNEGLMRSVTDKGGNALVEISHKYEGLFVPGDYMLTESAAENVTLKWEVLAVNKNKKGNIVVTLKCAEAM